MTLVEFLKARIVEEEAQARAVIDEIGGGRAGEPYDDGSGDRDRDDFPSHPWGSRDAELSFMAAWQPRRVLAECEAKRRIIAEHEVNCGGFCDWPTVISVELGREARTGLDAGLWGAIRILALPCADHPDYDAAWR